ncbi:DUF305 domain-containing protein, partial [Streptomyces xiaopingdaonensis]|uniref:DUF305 domain-containing protein n=1 Tax=Streptomyces xiaopingdaonensis TaxID=1565415 RepID=UPI00037F9B32
SDEPQAGPSVLAPGKPGESAKTLSADEARRKAGEQTRPNAADHAYVRHMIVHHRQALTMTKLAEKHAAKAKVRKVADRIRAAQGPEVKAMQGWQRTNGRAAGGGSDHDHAAMPGMATGAQLDRLRAARGAEFDALFLDLMTAHHRGALTMARELLAEGNDVRVEEMATDVLAQQRAEIGRMKKLG